MFLVFDKQKICTYLVSVMTVILLFGVALKINQEENLTNVSVEVGRKVPIYNVKTEEKKVALTMNCAWEPDDMEKILKTLKDNNVKITFFVVGEFIEKNPEVVQRMYEEGHEIASHSNTHPHVTKLSYEENIKEIEECNKKIEKITGKENKIYRAPYGEYNDTVIRAVESKNSYCIQWNLDTIDYKGLTGEEMWNRIKDKIKPGDIILTHSGTKHTADSLDMIIKNIKSKNLDIVKVSDIIYKENYKINENGTQIKK